MTLTAEQYTAFLALLAQPPRVIPELAALLRARRGRGS